MDERDKAYANGMKAGETKATLDSIAQQLREYHAEVSKAHSRIDTMQYWLLGACVMIIVLLVDTLRG